MRHIKTRRRTRHALGIASVMAAAMMTLAGPGPAGAAEAAPQLSIAVSNGKSAVASGDTLNYTITVNNLGDKRVKDLRVTQTLPPGLTFGSADASGAVAGDEVSWIVDIKANGKTTLHTTTSLGKTPQATLRLASVACASVSSKSPPVVCAASSNQLPAGAKADAKRADEAQGSSSIAIWVIAVGSLLVLGTIALAIVRARARARARGRRDKSAASKTSQH